MDLFKIISQLRLEQEKLDKVIAALEDVARSKALKSSSAPVRKRAGARRGLPASQNAPPVAAAAEETTAPPTGQHHQQQELPTPSAPAGARQD